MDPLSEEINWCRQDVIGLILMKAVHDSDGNPIEAHRFYKVGKLVASGKLVIIGTDRFQKSEFMNTILKEQNRFN